MACRSHALSNLTMLFVAMLVVELTKNVAAKSFTPTLSVTETADATLTATSSNDHVTRSSSFTPSRGTKSPSVTSSPTSKQTRTTTFSLSPSVSTSRHSATIDATVSATLEAKSMTSSTTDTFSETTSVTGEIRSVTSSGTAPKSQSTSDTWTRRDGSMSSSMTTSLTRHTLQMSETFSQTVNVTQTRTTTFGTFTDDVTPTRTVTLSKRSQTEDVSESKTAFSPTRTTSDDASLTRTLRDSRSVSRNSKTSTSTATNELTLSNSFTDASQTLPRNTMTVIIITATPVMSLSRQPSAERTSSKSHSITAARQTTTLSTSDDGSHSLSLRETHYSSTFAASKSETISLTFSFATRTQQVSLTLAKFSASRSLSTSYTYSLSGTWTVSLTPSVSRLTKEVTKSQTLTLDEGSRSSTFSLSNKPSATRSLSGNVSSTTLTLNVSFTPRSSTLSRTVSSQSTESFSPSGPSQTGSLTVEFSSSSTRSRMSSSNQLSMSESLSGQGRSASFSSSASATLSRSPTRDSRSLSTTLNESSVTPNMTASLYGISRTRPRTRSQKSETFTFSFSRTFLNSTTISPRISPTTTRTLYDTPPPPAPFLARVFFVPLSQSTDPCTTVNMWFVFPLAMLLVCELVVLWMMDSCGFEVTSDTYMTIPQWRSLLSRHTYLGVLCPCHFRCACIHTLRPLFHLTVATILYQAIIHSLKPQSMKFTILIALLAVISAQFTKPSFNLCFDYFSYNRTLTEEEQRKKREKELAKEEEERQLIRARRQSSFYEAQTRKLQAEFAQAVTHSDKNGFGALKKKASVRFKDYESARELELEEEARLERLRAAELAEEERKRKIQEEMYSVLEGELDLDFPADEEVQAAIVKKAKAASSRYVAFKIDPQVVDDGGPRSASPSGSFGQARRKGSTTSIDAYLEDLELGDDLVDISFPGEQPQFRSASFKKDDVPGGVSREQRRFQGASGGTSSDEGGGQTLDDTIVDISFPGEEAQLRTISFKNRPHSSESSLSFGLANHFDGADDGQTAAVIVAASPHSSMLSPSSGSRYALKEVPAVFRPSASFRQRIRSRSIGSDDGIAANNDDDDAWSVQEQVAADAVNPRMQSRASVAAWAVSKTAEGTSGSDPPGGNSASESSGNTTAVVAVAAAAAGGDSSPLGDESLLHPDGTRSEGSGTASTSLQRSSSSISTIKVRKEAIITHHRVAFLVFAALTFALVLLSSLLFQHDCFSPYYSEGWIVMVLLDVLFCDSVMIAASYVNRRLVVDESKGQKPYSELHPVNGLVRYVVHERDW